MSDNSEEQTAFTDRRTFLQNVALGVAAVTAGEGSGSAAPAPFAAGGGSGRLPRVSMEAQGIAPSGLLAFVEAVNADVGGLHSMMLLRHGKVACEAWWQPYAPSYPHMLYSLSKSFTSTAVGLAVGEGYVSVDEKVTSLFPDKVPARISDNLAAMRVRRLLTMNTGHDKDATGAATSAPDGDWARAFLALPVEHAPGSRFVYNSAATYMLSAIVQKRTGKTVLDYLTPRLFGPLGIAHPTWETCPRGINTGGWGLSIKTEDIARFGQLYLQQGEWKGQRLVPAAWVAQATKAQAPNGDPAAPSDWSQGYGYQFWRCRHNAYRGDGAFGQFCVVMPDQDAVLAVTSGVGDMQAVLNAVWKHLLPAMQAAPITSGAGREAAEPTGKTDKEVKTRLKTLAIPVPAGQAVSPTASRVTGKTFRFQSDLKKNPQQMETLSVVFQGRQCRLDIRNIKSEQRIECGPGGWTKGRFALEGTLSANTTAPAAMRGIWTDPDTYTITLCFYETPYVETITCRFAQNDVAMTTRRNVGFGPTDMPPLVGKAM